MRKELELFIIGLLSALVGAAVAWLAVRRELRHLAERVDYLQRKVDRQEQDYLMLVRSLLSRRPDILEGRQEEEREEDEE